MLSQDVIAAISTAPSEGGIAIVRVSGRGAWEAAKGVFRYKRQPFTPKPWRVYYGEMVGTAGETIDEGLCTYFRAPKSFTGEDVVELSVHGGVFVAHRVLEALLLRGVRPASPGEFTKRAFLNGRLDLAQAEAVIDVIRANNDTALRSAGQHLRGQLSTEVREYRRLLLNALAAIEVSIDFPEHDIPEVTSEAVISNLEQVTEKLKVLLKSTRAGRVAKEGLKVVLAGRPNVGKSSLLNRLAGQERAIVTEVAGTTRDTVEVHLSLDGILVNVVDTAGLRESTDVVESLGIARTEQAMEDADVLLVVLDGSQALEEEDLALIRRTEGRRRIVVATKSDLFKSKGFDHPGSMSISSVTGAGIAELKKQLTEIAKSAVGPENSLLVTNLRHSRVLEDVLESVEQAVTHAQEGWGLEVVAVGIRTAYERLGEISGETINVDVAEAIFTQFCVGK